MNKAELIDAVAEKVGDKKTATAAVEAVLETVQGAVARGEKVAVTGFGVFERVDRPARTARNPATGENVDVAATRVIKFKPAAALKSTVAGS